MVDVGADKAEEVGWVGRAKKGEKGRNPHGGKGKPQVVLTPEELKESVDPGADMLWVYGNPKGSDKTPGQKAYRKWLEKDPRGFLVAMQQMRGKVVEAPVEEGKVEEPVVVADGGEEKVEELVERLLGEWREQSAR